MATKPTGPGVTEVLDFQIQLDTKLATKETRTMQAALKNLYKAIDTGEKGLKEQMEAVTDGLKEHRDNLKHLQEKYLLLRKVGGNFSSAAVQGWDAVQDSVTDAIASQEKYLEGLKKLGSAEEAFSKKQEDLASKKKEMDEAEIALQEAKKKASEAALEAQTEAAEAAVAAAEEAVKKTSASYNSEKKALEGLTAQVEKHRKYVELSRRAANAKGNTANAKLGGLGEVSAGAQRAAERMSEKQDQQAKAVQEFEDSLSDYSFKDAGQDFFESVEEGLDALKGKDPLGILKAVAKAALKPAAMGVGKGIQSAALSPGAGKMAQGMAGSMSKVVSAFAKAGPILTALGGAVVGLVKMFLDADAAAKEFNRELITGGSTAEFMSSSAVSSTRAMARLTMAMNSARDAAHDFSFNNDWGVTAKDHSQLLSTLQQEGKTLKEMDDEARRAGKSMGQFGQELLAVSVTYSRSFGVSLQEIGQLQGQLMAETGMSSESVKTSFEQVLISAKDSGIGVNKFFNIIRSMSYEMTLFNFRMEEAAQVLKAVGKAMSARNAEKFLQTVSQFYKGMGFEDRIKQTRMAGQGNTKAILKEDFAQKGNALAMDFEKSTGKAGSGEALKKAMQGSNKELRDFLLQFGDSVPSAMKDSIFEAQRANKQAGGGLVGTAAALKNAGPGAAMKMLNQVSKNLVGSKLSEASEINYLAITKLTGLTEEQIDGFYKMERSMDLMRGEIGQRAASGTMKAEDREFLAKAGIKTEGKTGAEIQQAIEALDDSSVFNALSVSQQKALEESAGTQDYAKKQTELLQDFNTKIENLVSFLQNKFYNVVDDIRQTLVAWVGSPEQKKALEQEKLVRGDKYLSKLDPSTDYRAFAASKVAEGYQKADEGTRKSIASSAFATTSRDSMLESLKAAGISPEKISEITSKLDAGKSKSIMGSLVDKASSGTVTMESTEDARKLMEGDLLTADQKKAFLASTLKNQSLGQLTSNKGYALGAEGAPGAPGSGPAPGSGGPAGPTPSKPTVVTLSGSDAATNLDHTSKIEEQTAQQAADAEKLHKVVKKEGVKIDKGTIEGPVKKSVEDATLESIRKALFEYYLYKDVPVDAMIAGIQGGNITASGPGRDAFEQVSRTGKAFDPKIMPANAEGGLVLKPAPGEVVASVAPGERILPRGASGSSVTLNLTVNGAGPQELKAIMERKVRQGFDEYRRMQQAGDLDARHSIPSVFSSPGRSLRRSGLCPPHGAQRGENPHGISDHEPAGFP